MRSIRLHSRRPVVITEARGSGDEEFETRRRRYLIMMTGRALCIIAAAAVLQVSGWLSAAFVAGALVLPWTAVLIANDRPPKEALRFRRFVPGLGGPAELPAPERAAARSSDEPRPPDPGSGQPATDTGVAGSAPNDADVAADGAEVVRRPLLHSTMPLRPRSGEGAVIDSDGHDA